MKKKLKVGDTIKVKKEHKQELLDRFNEVRAIEESIRSLSLSKYELMKKTWNFIYEAYPEFKNWNISYDHNNGFFIIKEELTETEQIFRNKDYYISQLIKKALKNGEISE